MLLACENGAARITTRLAVRRAGSSVQDQVRNLDRGLGTPDRELSHVARLHWRLGILPRDAGSDPVVPTGGALVSSTTIAARITSRAIETVRRIDPPWNRLDPS